VRCPNCGNAIRGVVGPGPAVQVLCEHCKWWFDPKLPKNERPEAPITVAALEPGALALFIVRWLRERNNGELFATFAEMKVGDYEHLTDELALILEHGGCPPNWKPVTP
jgi:hypothetical protein